MKFSKNKDRAVSEIIGFMIIFGVLLGTISLVYLNAVPRLGDVRDTEHVNNAERAFSVLQDNLNDIIVRGDQARGTEINIRDSELKVGGLTWVNVSIGGERYNNTLNRIVYRVGGERVVYENGAVIRASGDGSAMVFEPDWRVTDDTVIVPVIRTSGNGSFVGSETILVRASGGISSWDVNHSKTVEISVHSEYSRAWENYMRGFTEADSVTVNGDKVTMEIINVDRVLYAEYLVDVRLQA